MQPIQLDQASFLLHGVYLPGLKNEHRITKSVIEAIPVDQGDYRPDGISKSALDLAWHIVATEMRFMDALQAGAFDFSPRPRPDAIGNSQDLNGWYSENFTPRFAFGIVLDSWTQKICNWSALNQQSRPSLQFQL